MADPSYDELKQEVFNLRNELTARKELYEILADTLNDVVCIFDPQGQIVEAGDLWLIMEKVGSITAMCVCFRMLFR